MKSCSATTSGESFAVSADGVRGRAGAAGSGSACVDGAAMEEARVFMASLSFAIAAMRADRGSLRSWSRSTRGAGSSPAPAIACIVCAGSERQKR